MSLRSDIYKTPRAHEVTLCRTHDLAEVVRSHCKPYTGLLVQITGKPHRCTNFCFDCGQEVCEYFVECWQVHATEWYRMPGPWFMPIDWLKRIDPRDPVTYPKWLNYRPLEPTAEQMKSWNPLMNEEAWVSPIVLP